MIKRLGTLLALAVALPSVALPSVAQAKGNSPPASCAVSTDRFFQAATFNWGAGIQYLDCYGPVGGNDNGNQAATINANWGSYGTFALVGKSGNEGSAPLWLGADGSLVFESPISGYFALTLKQAPQFSVYLFYAEDPVSSINWDTRGVADNGGTGEDKLSHAVLYAGPGAVSTVPEPSTYLLMGSGLAGLLGIAGWRRRA